MALARYQVVIVGGGPVGLGLAVELGQRGIHCVLLERHREPQRIPKGQNLTNRTLEHFYFWSCVDELRAERVLPPGYPTGGVTVYGNLMSPYSHATEWSGRGSSVQDYFYERDERLPQYSTEAVLRNRLRELRSVETLFGWNAEAIEQDDDGVRVTGAATSGGERRGLEADYLVGCDGARSQVRERVGIDRGGRDFDQRMVLGVLRSRELHAALKRFPNCTTYRVLKPELKGLWQFFGRIDVGEGFFFHAPVPKDTPRDGFDLASLVHEAAGFPFEAEVDHVGFWDLRIMVASQYSRGRVFLAGDACHQHPPYGGFGLNIGMEDAANLGWKLAATLQGWGGQRLLDSYHDERRPIFVETGETIIGGGIDRDRAFLERFSPDRNRGEFEQAWNEMARTTGFSAHSYDPHYAGSPVVSGPPDRVCGIHGPPAFAARAGHHLAPRRLSSGRNVFQELGDAWTLLAFDAERGSVEAIEQAAKGLRLPLEVIRDTFEGDRAAYAARLVLVRPDQFVAWVGDEAPVDSMDLLRLVSGGRV